MKDTTRDYLKDHLAAQPHTSLGRWLCPLNHLPTNVLSGSVYLQRLKNAISYSQHFVTRYWIVLQGVTKKRASAF